jgi:hypothetical protein
MIETPETASLSNDRLFARWLALPLGSLSEMTCWNAIVSRRVAGTWVDPPSRVDASRGVRA